MDCVNLKAGQRSKAIELLTKQINQQPTNKLHHILGKFNSKGGYYWFVSPQWI